MQNNVIGKDPTRWDAHAKVTGKAMFTADFYAKNMLHGKILRSTIAHGYVKAYDIAEALQVPGVVRIILPEDLPDTKFSTAGHPYSLNPKTRDIEDRSILTRAIHQHGDDIAAVVATTELAAIQAIEKIKVTYEEYPVYLTPEEALKEGAMEIHPGSKNIIADTTALIGDLEEGFRQSDYIFEDTFETQIVQHCHMESQVAYAYQDVDQRWTVVSSTQIPHICRRVLGQAFNLPWSKFRVKKPFIGGGFGNKQDVTIEPIVAAMSMLCGGKPVIVSLTREESIAYTRVRHAISYKMKIGLTKDGEMKALDVSCISNNGGYASHGHAIAGKGGGFIHALYKVPNLQYKAKTVYTNTAAAGAMRGYGIPQVMFALEALVHNVCATYGFDPIEFRLKNITERGAFNQLNHIHQFTNELDLCITEGAKKFHWIERQKEIEQYNTDTTRRGLGIATFSYGSGTFPKSYEIGGCRLILNQDGTVKMMLGATEIGQGSDTVFSQMVAETLGISFENVYADFLTDTDIAPFDTGAYASRQSYVTGMAVRKAAQELKDKIYKAVKTFCDLDRDYLDIVENNVVYRHNSEVVISLADLALKTYYDPQHGECLTSDVSFNCHNNSYSMGATFAYVEVDLITGKTKILDILNAHDSGTILNPVLASGQVEGGMMMAIGYALSEELKYNKAGVPLNNNLLDYKFPTIMDIPSLQSLFIEVPDPVCPYGNKSLGEPPTCSPAPAIRNAICNAIDAKINSLPINGEKVAQVLRTKSL